MSEKREAKILFNKAGGNAGKGAYNTKISLPKSWVDALGYTNEDREAILEFDGEKIIIRKKR